MHRVEIDRISARHALATSERHLSGIIFDRLADSESIGRIHSKGDEALFGGTSTADMKSKLGVPKGRALADFLPLTIVKVKDLANELTQTCIIQDHQRTETDITLAHVANNLGLRRVLIQCRILPEHTAPVEDIEKVERRFRKEQNEAP